MYQFAPINKEKRLNTPNDWTDEKVLRVVEEVEYESLDRLHSSLRNFNAILAVFIFPVLWYCNNYYSNFKSEVIVDTYGWTNQVSSPSNLPRVILLVMSTTLLVCSVLGLIISRMKKYTNYDLEELEELAQNLDEEAANTELVPPTHKPIL